MGDYTSNKEEEPRRYSCVRVLRGDEDARQKIMDAVESYLGNGVKVLEIFIDNQSMCKVRKTRAGVWINPIESQSTFHEDTERISPSIDIVDKLRLP